MITSIDFSILDIIRENFSCSVLDNLMPMITFLGNGGLIWIIASLAMMFSRKYRKNGIMLAAALICCLIVGNLLMKNIFARSRPCWINDTVPLLIAVPQDYSFPSGHTMSSFAAAYIISCASKRLGIAAYILAILIGFSRLYLYVHFPSDVLGGIILGTASALFSRVICKKIIKKTEKKRSELIAK